MGDRVDCDLRAISSSNAQTRGAMWEKTYTEPVKPNCLYCQISVLLRGVIFKITGANHTMYVLRDLLSFGPKRAMRKRGRRLQEEVRDDRRNERDEGRR